MAKKKDKPQIINNIGELNLEIDYGSDSESTRKKRKRSQQKEEVHVRYIRNDYISCISRSGYFVVADCTCNALCYNQYG